jgi:hypothetical protein
MHLASPSGIIRVVNEPTYSFGSPDNARRYPLEIELAPGSRPTSIHGVLLDEVAVAVFSNGGGASAVHDHSALLMDSLLYLAIGDSVACLDLQASKMIWSVQVDSATCFGIYYDDARRALISHGELEIARLTADGSILWQASGADVFSEAFALRPEFIEAVDFNQRAYRFSYDDGRQVTR